MTLQDVAKVVRSKNAGPVTLTLDVMFEREADYQHWVQSPSLSAARIGALYGVDPARVAIHPYPAALAIKITLPRKVVAGDPGDRDVYGAQQHARLLGIEA